MDKKKDISSKMKDDIILDNGSTLSIFANPELVEGIRKSKSTLEMATNAGMRLTNQEANVPGFGTVWYDEGAIVNIFSFAELVDKHQITFDSSMENAFLVHQPDKIVKFERTPEGLYTYRVDKDYKKSLTEKGNSHLVTTLTVRTGKVTPTDSMIEPRQHGSCTTLLGCQQWRISKRCYA